MTKQFIMVDGKLVKMLLHTKVTKYLEWQCVNASYVCQMVAAGYFSAAKMQVCKVPANDMEALKSNLMGLFEKKLQLKKPLMQHQDGHGVIKTITFQMKPPGLKEMLQKLEHEDASKHEAAVKPVGKISK